MNVVTVWIYNKVCLFVNKMKSNAIILDPYDNFIFLHLLQKSFACEI